MVLTQFIVHVGTNLQSEKKNPNQIKVKHCFFSGDLERIQCELSVFIF